MYTYIYIYILLYVGIHMKNKASVIYPDKTLAIRYVPHNDDIPIPIPPDNLDSSSESDDENEINDDLSQEYIPNENKRYFKTFNQHDLNDLTRYLVLSKESAQLLGSRLAERKMLSKETT